MMKWHLELWRHIEKPDMNRQSGAVIFGIDGLDDALEAIKAGEMQGTVYNDKEDQELQIAKLAVEIFRGEDVNRKQLKEGRYYVSEYQPVYSGFHVEDFIKRQTR